MKSVPGLSMRQKLASVVAACPMAMLACDAEGRVSAWNPAAERLLGWNGREMLGRELALDWDGEGSLRARGLAGEIVTGVEVGHRLPSGESCCIRVSIAPMVDGDGVRSGFMLVAEDVSEHKRAAEGLVAALERERRARDLADTARLQMGLLSYASQILDASFEFLQEDWRTSLTDLGYMVVATVADYCAIYEMKPDRTTVQVAEVLSNELPPLHLPSVPARSRADAALIARALGGELVLIPDLASDSADGGEAGEGLLELGLRSLIVVPLTARGRTFGALVLGASIRSGRRYERADVVFAQELAKRTAVALDNVQLFHQSQRAARLREDILAITSHDLRSPLNVIGLSASSLLRRLPPGSPDFRQLQVVARSAQQMQRLVADLLDVAQIEAGQLAIDPVPLSPKTLIDEALALHGPDADARGVFLSAEVAAGLPLIAADRDRMLQVFANLVGNAIRFTPEGGRIVLSARPASGGVRFAVADTGQGIPAADLGEIFVRYRRSGRGKKHGAGLGLAIVRGIVESHGGTIAADSREGEGTVFHFFLPRVAGD